ncbi:MAG: hypothetical protein JJ896_13835 [Rhodothermales bacterium]|nr:hypothetical protein [Rhodothermales bacterium]MBO6780730.1 hypothetical protein [Rhodothermales bacterium]
MGQQQLLLLVIGVILVGIAVIAGIQAATDGFGKSEADGIMSRNLAIASNAVFWKTKSDPFAGGNQSYSLLGSNGLATLAMDTETELANWAITNATATSIEISGVSKRNANIGVRTYVNNYSIDSTIVRFDGSITLE